MVKKCENQRVFEKKKSQTLIRQQTIQFKGHKSLIPTLLDYGPVCQMLSMQFEKKINLTISLLKLNIINDDRFDA